MTDALDSYGDALRSALRTDADAVVPAPDGLDRIRARTTFVCSPYEPDRAWLSSHDLIAVAALSLILLFTLGGS